MRICLLSIGYPPESTEGIARQRQSLATELVRLGHEVHVITCGPRRRSWNDTGASIHTTTVPRSLRYSPKYPELDRLLTISQALYEELATLTEQQSFDIVDVPLWMAQGFVTHQRYLAPTVLWLQTTSAQLYAINGQRPSPADRARLNLERICIERSHGLLGDSSDALHAVISDYAVRPTIPTEVVHLGLQPLPENGTQRPQRHMVEALVVGRLERRKGTPILFELLPDLLQRQPRLTVRFIGRDNSANDGWQARHSLTYPEYFRKHYPNISERVLFEGYVSESQLAEAYRHADFFLAPSLYESFGLHFLEAMRVALPVATFAVGGAAEIFAAGEATGGVLAPAGNSRLLGEGVERLVDDPQLRRRIGEAGLARFRASFTAAAMAKATLRFYEQVIASQTSRMNDSRPIYQVMDALAIGDAVSNIARCNATILGELGQPDFVLTRSAPSSISKKTAPLEHAFTTPKCNLLFHYWGYNTAIWMINTFRGRKALYFHNITPCDFFPPASPIHKHLARGHVQLSRIAKRFDVVIGDSRYNLTQLASSLERPTPSLHIYPVVERGRALQASYDRKLVAELRTNGATNLLFVGRVAPNKRFDNLMQLFDLFAREINPQARLWLVGNESFDPSYRSELERLRRSLKMGDRITFTGKVSDAAMYAYYRGADVFVCASEHEGFCVPVAEAMAFGLPVVALAAAALPETLGPSPGLLTTWDTVSAAELVNDVLIDERKRQTIQAVQFESLERFTLPAARERLQAVVQFLLTGMQHPIFENIPAKAESPE